MVEIDIQPRRKAATCFSRSFGVGFGACAAWGNAYKSRRSEEPFGKLRAVSRSTLLTAPNPLRGEVEPRDLRYTLQS